MASCNSYYDNKIEMVNQKANMEQPGNARLLLMVLQV